ncbi:DUF2169 family type VI secretion system accessory protein [Pyxidicoccus fallax]|uniref:DUF2169 domain-containing protein n=1 Tax=Pyxidicoccus fallax TaxID=394095 RepID=A0A848LGR4_9BACT|nr:DUF2169 domain-containing protein [Pyxidicoccus fallax]NMO16615.1 DUF2169 domain-containing protein [Pyxidicoccus fallax]
MWVIKNDTPYSAERNWVRDKSGVHHWLVAVKATFDISPSGQLRLSDDQPPPLLEPKYHGEPGRSSLRFDSDLLAVKPATDVILNGFAHAPKRKPTPSVPVSLRVGDMQKVLVVHGPRVYYRGLMGLTTSKPQPFTRQAILYEWAFGGLDTSDPDPRKHRLDARNPVGKGIASSSATLENQPVYAVEYPDGRHSVPAGFGAIDRWWTPRRELAGTYGEHWEQTRKPLLPLDYDERFALCSPEDQRPRSPLRGAERVELVHLTPDSVLRFELPKTMLSFKTYFGRRTEEHTSFLATVIIDPEAMKLMMVWQSSLRVRAPDANYLDVTHVTEKLSV